MSSGRPRAADDFEEIRTNLRKNAEEEGRCTCPKNESGNRLESSDLCSIHGKWLGERGKQT